MLLYFVQMMMGMKYVRKQSFMSIIYGIFQLYVLYKLSMSFHIQVD